eukprot:4058656-Amphidinium_carterae.1
MLQHPLLYGDAPAQVSSPEEELVLRDLAFGLDAGPVSHRCVSWHALRAVAQLYSDAIVSQAEQTATKEEDIYWPMMFPYCHHCAAA